MDSLNTELLSIKSYWDMCSKVLTKVGVKDTTYYMLKHVFYLGCQSLQSIISQAGHLSEEERDACIDCISAELTTFIEESKESMTKH